MNEIPQELLDEMIHLNAEQFKRIEEKWLTNLTAKAEYEKQYFAQIGQYALHNHTYKQNTLPLTPSQHNLAIDAELLKEAKAINRDNARMKTIQQESIPTVAAQEKETEKEPEQQKQLELENPAPSHITNNVTEITARLFAAMKYETLEKEWEAQLNHPANDLHPNEPQFEMEL